MVSKGRQFVKENVTQASEIHVREQTYSRSYSSIQEEKKIQMAHNKPK